MTHELDHTIQQAARMGGATRRGHPSGEVARKERGCGADARSRARERDDVRMDQCFAGRPLTRTSLRVIETTWRLWRKPHGG